MTPILTQIKQARIEMLLGHPFFGGPSLRLELVEDNSLPAPLGTDGTHLFYNRNELERLAWSKPETVSVVCHEVLHCVMLHMLRRRGRDQFLWNVATDFAINVILTNAGLRLPGRAITLADIISKGKRGKQDKQDENIHLCDPAFRGWAAERIYDKLREHVKILQVGGCSPAGDGPPGGECTLPGLEGKNWNVGGVHDAPSSKAADQQVEWQQAARQAAQIAKGRGKLPADLASFIDELLDPTVDWKSILWEFVQTCLDRTDYTWARPNIQFASRGIYMPRLWGERTPALAVCIDTSGSTGSKPIRMAFSSEIAGIAEETRPQRLYVFHSDAIVHKVQVFEYGEDVIIEEFIGNGGTDFRPVFKYIQENGLDQEIACLIYLTDLDGPFPEVPPQYPVLWATVTDQEAPWGETIKVKLGE